VITRINASDAGVTATYDATNDTVQLTADATGSTTIALADTTGNFLAAFELLSAPQTLGTSASYQIDGGPLQYSSSNSVTDGVPGVTLSLLETTTSAVTVTVNASTSAVRSRMADFIEQFNSTLELIRGHTEYEENGESGVLIGDGMVRGLDLSLRSMVTRPAFGVSGDIRSLGDIGVSFGSAGAEVGTTSLLTLNTAKFEDALKDNPEAVQRLLTTFSASAALETNTGAIASVSGNPTSVRDSGLYTFDSTLAGGLTVSFQPDNGGSLQVSTYSITPGEVNTTIIPGMTITFGNPLVAGTDTIRITASEEGIAKSLHEYVEAFTRTGGLMGGRDAQLQGEVDDLNARIDLVNERAESKREQLILKFAKFEVTMQRLQNQQSALSTLVAAMRPPARR
jgi:flagellar hook-associated protein 2